MECKNCGNSILEGDKFCSKCGTRIVEEMIMEAKVHTNDQEIQSECVKATDVTMESRPLKIPEEKISRSKSRWEGMFKGRNIASDSEKPKRQVPKVVLGILGLAAVVLIANSAKLVNSYHRNFSTPEEYYRWVEQKTIQKNAKSLSEYYRNHFVEYLHRYDRHASGEIRLELGDAGRDMMELAGLDPWFEEGAFNFESTCKDSVVQSIWAVEIGGEELFDIDAIMDLGDEAMYLGFPRLTRTYLAVDTDSRKFAESFKYVSGMEPEEYLEYLELLEVFYKRCPDKSQIEALANRYLKLLLDSVDNVRMRTGKTVRVGSITQTCTTLEIYLDKDDIQNMLTEFLEELQEDSEIEELLLQVFDHAAELDIDMENYRDADEFYEAFQDYVDEFLDDMEYQNDLTMTVYVDNKGQIIGRAMEFSNSWDELSLSYLNPHHGSKFGYKASIVVNGEEMSVTGSGKDFGNKVNGSFTVRYDGTGIIDIEVEDFDMKSLKKGYLNGCFTVTASSGIGRASDMGSAYSYLRDMKLIIDVSMNRSSEKLKIELKEGRELWGTLTITTKSDSGKKISVPSTKRAIFVDDERDFEDWWATIEWDDILRKMDKAGLPSEAIDTVEEFGEMDINEIMDELTRLMWPLMYHLLHDLY